MKKFLILAVGLSLFAMPQTYKSCVGCHGFQGNKKAFGKSRELKTLSKKEFIDAIDDYKKGNRNIYGFGGLMKSQVINLTDNQIKEIIEYLKLK